MGVDLILLDTHVSMFGARVRIALAEKGVNDYQYKEQDLRNKQPFLLQMNPVHKKIPVLIHNGKPICESLIIVEYIDEVWKDTSPLLPSDPYQRAQARFWADFTDKKVYWIGTRLWVTTGDELKEKAKEFIEALKALEGHLGDKSFFGGESFGFLDVAVISYYCWFDVNERYGGFTIEDHCPKLINWAKRCMERHSVSASLAHPNEVHDFVLGLRKILGFLD